LPQAENHRNGKLMSRCAETVEDENCLWKQMEKRKTILLRFFELLSILSLVTFVGDVHHHPFESSSHFFVEKSIRTRRAYFFSASSEQWLNKENSK
jgi:hypothetical protein